MLIKSRTKAEHRGTRGRKEGRKKERKKGAPHASPSADAGRVKGFLANPENHTIPAIPTRLNLGWTANVN